MKMIIGRDAADWVEACGLAREAIGKGEEVCEIENPEDGGKMTARKYDGEPITAGDEGLSLLFECRFNYYSVLARLKDEKRISYLCRFEKKPRGFKTLFEFQNPLDIAFRPPFAVQIIGWEKALAFPAHAVPVFTNEKAAKRYKNGPFIYIGKPWKGFPERYALAVYEWGATVLRREMLAKEIQRSDAL